MHFKLIIAFVEDTKTDKVLDAAREQGATGATVISQARGEGLEQAKTFFGLTLETQRDVLLLLVEEHMSTTSASTCAPWMWRMPSAFPTRSASSVKLWRMNYDRQTTTPHSTRQRCYEERI